MQLDKKTSPNSRENRKVRNTAHDAFELDSKHKQNIANLTSLMIIHRNTIKW